LRRRRPLSPPLSFFFRFHAPTAFHAQQSTVAAGIDVAPVFSVPIGSMGGSAVTGGAACCPFITSPTVHVRRRICWSDPLVNQVLLHLRSVIHAVIRWSIRLRFAYFSQAHALQVMAVPHVKKIFTRKSVVAASCF
jgi:hypothetical protein